MKRNISKIDLFFYGLLGLPLAFAGIPLYINAPDFYASNYGISLSSLGVILLIIRCIDAIQDPIIGIVTDRFAKLRPYIIICSTIVLSISFTLLFYPMNDNYLLWFSVTIFLATSSFSALTISLNTLGALWSDDKNQKTTIAGFREGLGLIGLMLAAMLPSVLQEKFEPKIAFLIVSGTLAILMLIAVSLFIVWQNRNKEIAFKTTDEKFSFKDFLKISRNTKKFFVIYTISMLASSIPSVLVLFFIRDRLGLESHIGLFLLAYFLSGAIGILIWQKTSVIYGKYKSWLFSMILAVIVFAFAYFLEESDIIPYLIICILSGVAFGADLVLPPSILADHIQDNNKESQASAHYGVLAFLAKLALALSAAIALPLLDFYGFEPNKQNNQTSLEVLSLTYAVIPCIIKLISITLLWIFNDEKAFNGSNNRSDNNA